MLRSFQHTSLRTLAPWMLNATCFGGETACDPQWWKMYLDITKRVEGDVCTRLGVRPRKAHSAGGSLSCDSLSTDDACEMVIERASMSRSIVRKVQIAGNAFDAAYSEASNKAPCRVSLKRLSRVWDAPSNSFKDDLSVGGRFLSDLERIVTDRGLSTAIRVNLCDKTISYASKDAALKAMRILIEYMAEYRPSTPRAGASAITQAFLRSTRNPMLTVGRVLSGRELPLPHPSKRREPVGSIRPRVSIHPRVSKFPIRKRSLMEIRRRKRKWDTLGGGHSWDGTS